MSIRVQNFFMFASTLVTGILFASIGWSEAPKASESAVDSTKDGWVSLIRKSELAPWEKTNFGGEGEVDVKDGVLTLHMGQPLTGVTYSGKDFPKEDFEIRWEARRVSGQDFFVGITFPVGDEFVSFIGGGWGGSLTGFSSVDGNDASENETSGFEDFKNDRWYSFRVQVSKTHVSAWINDRLVAQTERAEHHFSVRIEVSSNEPLGYCTYNTTAEVRNWEYRKLVSKSEKDKASEQPPNPAASDRTTPTSSRTAIPIHDEPIFVRIRVDTSGQPLALQTSVSSYSITEGPFAGATVDLIGAVHVAESDYYDELNRRFQSYESLLYELVADPSVKTIDRRKDRGVYNPISAAQVGMKEALKLQFQLDKIDYRKKNFVHADMTPEEFMADMKKRKDDFFSMSARILGSSLAAQASSSASGADAKLIAAMVAKNQVIALRRLMAEQFENMEYQLMGLEDANGKSTLLTERNRKAFEVLEQQLKKGERKLGIFYGAAHLKDMDRRLIDNFGAVRGNVSWLDAWKLAEK